MFAKPPFPGGEWLVLVDGLDELMSAELRRAVMTKLAGIQDQGEPLYRFVVATRPLPEDESVIPPGWAPWSFELLPFTTSQFSEVATNWFRWLKPKETADAVERFVAQVQERGLTEVARNPLMATILCQLFAANPEVSLPPGRTRIFDEFEELLNRRQYGNAAGGIRYELVAALAPFGTVAEEAGQQLLARAPSLIGRLAWHRISGGTASTMDLVDDWLAGLKPNHVPALFWRGVLRDLLRRSGVLQERADDFVFSHQTIAEHRAAKYVTADAVRSDAEFGKLFRQASWRDAQSYARFLVAAWSGRSDLPSALNRVVEKEGLDGAQFVASLRTDGIELPQELYNCSLDRLASFAVDPELPEPDRRGAAETVLAGDKTAGISLLASAVRARALDTSYRIWALETLAGVRHRPPRGPAPRSLESALLHAMRSLVEHDDAYGRELIAFVAGDSSWPEQGREWAVQALRAVGRLAADVLEPLINTVLAVHPTADAQLIERAYDVAAYWHQGQKRKSGDPYISHPLAVATILAQLGMNTDTICAALLHDTVEDTPYTLVELKGEFGKDVAALVDGVTKLDKGKYGEAAETETVRKLMVAGARDVRVWIIEFACRLHDMRTLRYLPREVQERKATEVLELIAPLAHRLGMNTIKWELEDLAFATLYPKRFDEIARLTAQRAPKRDVFLQEVIERVTTDLHEAKIKNKVTSRPRHYYSIYREMIARNVSFDDIYDLVGIRVLVDSVQDCYAALGTLHGRWNPVPGRFKDYIATPKFDMYQSLQTTVIGPGRKPVALQIRTRDMHKRAEYGIAAHWKYEEDMVAHGPGQGARKTGSEQDEAMEKAWLRQLVDWQGETEDAERFLDSLRFDLAASEVYVFTPRGKVIALPPGATPVDFAYAIHTEVGHRTIGARVNGHSVALETALDNCDTVEIFKSKEQEAGPNRDWLGFVKSARARNRIRQWFSQERSEVAVAAGMNQIARFMRKQGVPLQRMVTGRALLAIAQDLRYADMSGLYAAVGEGRISAQSVVTELVDSLGLMYAAEDLAETTLPGKSPRQRASADSLVEVEGAVDVSVRLSRCCNPVPGDEIRGLVTHGHGTSVHRTDCVTLAHLTQAQSERMVTVHWALAEASVFQVAIQVEALNRIRLLSDVTGVLSVQHVTILSASVTTRRDRMVIGKFTLEMGDPRYLNHVLRALKSIEGVSKAFRISM
jgi:GTP diphosphokinase / guanosine-3',5'-bis(diphosphate) 3'-diphosphatase